MKTWKTMKILLTASVMAFIASSCDDGKIYPQISEAEGSGRVLEIKVRFTNVDQWPSTENYCVLFAGFKEDGTYPSISKNIGTPVEGKDMEFTLSNVPEDVTTASICITSLSHKLIYHIYTTETGKGLSAEIDAGTIEMKSLYSFVQDGIFNSRCISCHGDGGTAAGLDLTKDKSHEMLIDKPATTDPSYVRVVAGNATESYLYRIMTEDTLEANESGYNHPMNVNLRNDMTLLIKEWINSGACK